MLERLFNHGEFLIFPASPASTHTVTTAKLLLPPLSTINS